MRKYSWLVLALLILVLVAPVFAVPDPADELAQVRHKINNLQQQLSNTRNPRIRSDLQTQIRNLRARELRLQEQVRPVNPNPPIQVSPQPPVNQPPVVRIPPDRVVTPRRAEPIGEIGLAGGYIAGATGIGGQLGFYRPFDLVGMLLRLSAAYATDTKDTSGATRKNAIAAIDMIYKLNPPGTKGIRSYFGLGANYVALTSGQTQGAIGGQAIFGLEGALGGGDLFLEAGYGIFRPRVSEDRSGLNMQLGYKFRF